MGVYTYVSVNVGDRGQATLVPSSVMLLSSSEAGSFIDLELTREASLAGILLSLLP